MEFYDKKLVEKLKKECHTYYVPDLLFDGSEYKLVRLEVKWAYVACLNVLLNNALFDNDGYAYFKDDNPMLIETLAKLANKKVDSEKMKGYISELENVELLTVSARDVYLKRIEHIF